MKSKAKNLKWVGFGPKVFNFYKNFFVACDKIKKAWICNECKKPELSHACYGDITDFRRRRRAVLWTDREATNHELAKTFSGISSTFSDS